MNSDTPAPRPEPELSFAYDDGTRLHEVREGTRSDGSVVTTYTFSLEPRQPMFQCEHDKAKGLFILTWYDGTIERFRDKPARQLMVEPDPETGELRPVVKCGQPVYCYLCREEREGQ